MLGNARDEAVAGHHDYVGPEQILIALAKEREGVAFAVLQRAGITLDKVQHRLSEIVPNTTAHASKVLDLPYTFSAKKALEHSMEEARVLNHGYVGTEHMLLALLHADSGVSAQVLTELGLEPDSARAQVVKLLGA